MTEESKTEDYEARLATLRGRNELVNAKLENLSDRELDSFNKQTLVFLAGLFNISYSGLSELKLRNKIKERRDEIYMMASELPEKPATDPTPKEQSDRLPGSAGRSNANESDREPMRDRDDQSESRSLGDPPGLHRSTKDGENDPQIQGNQGGGSFRGPIGSRSNQETPGGRSRTSLPTSIDVSAYVRANMEAAGLDPSGGLDYNYMGVTRRDLDLREEQQRLAMDERDERLRIHIKEQMNDNFEALRQLIDTKLQFQDREGTRSSGFADVRGEDWDTATNAAFGASRRTDINPPLSSQRFGATSPANSFRGRPVNLGAVDEEGFGGRRSPMLSPPLGGRSNRYAHGRNRDDESSLSNPPIGQHPFRSSRFHLSHSPLNDPKRGELYNKYLGGIDGLDLMDYNTSFLEELGFEGREMETTIMRDIAALLDRWEAPDVNPKYYSGFTKLEELTVESIVDFYNHIQHQLKRYHIGLMPFDCIIPRWHHVGMTYPGMGETKYIYQAETLFNILEKLLPVEDTIVKQCITTLLGSSHDGFKLLRIIFGKTVPVFCLYIPSVPPKWQNHQDVAQMAKLWKLHFRLESKTGGSHSPIQQSLMFLQSLDDPSLSPHLTSIRSSIQLFTETMTEHDETTVPLPSNLTIDGITTTLTAFPATMNSTINYATSNNFSMVTFADLDSELDMQGLVSSATTTTKSRTPRRNRETPKPKNANKDVVCRGCHKKGHVEVDCRELAKWIILSQAVKKLPDRQRKKVLEAYYKHYSTAPPNPTIARSYSTILQEFCANRNLTMEQVIANYNWDGFTTSSSDSDDDGFETAAEGEDGSE